MERELAHLAVFHTVDEEAADFLGTLGMVEKTAGRAGHGMLANHHDARGGLVETMQADREGVLEPLKRCAGVEGDAGKGLLAIPAVPVPDDHFRGAAIEAAGDSGIGIGGKLRQPVRILRGLVIPGVALLPVVDAGEALHVGDNTDFHGCAPT